MRRILGKWPTGLTQVKLPAFWLRWILGALLAGIFFMYGLRLPEYTSGEAWVRDAACRQLAANTTEGRQALVSSIWWAPLPTLARLPLAACLEVEGTAVASLLLSAIFGAAMVMLMEYLLMGWGLGMARYLFVGAWVLNPFFLVACISGSSHTMLAFGAVTAFSGLVGWMAWRKMRYLLVFAGSAAFLIGSDFVVGVWAMALMAVFLLDTLIGRRLARGERESLLILGFAPPVYVVGLWILSNWLIMGDGFFFVRSVTPGRDLPGGLAQGVWAWLMAGPGSALESGRALGVGVVHHKAVLVALVASVAAWLARRTGGLYPGVAVVLLAGVGLLFGVRGNLWDPAGPLLCLAAIAVVAIGFLAGGIGLAPRRLRFLVGLIPVVLSCAAGLQFVSEGWATRLADRGAAFSRGAVARDVERHVLKQSPRYARVFVAGYEGLALLGGDTGGVFSYALDFNFNKVKADYGGHNLYLLVRQPVGRGSTDSIHRQYDGIYFRGSRSTLHDRDWGDWRLFEIIQAARR